MILVSINNIVELFFLRQLNVFSSEQSPNAVKILLLAPYSIAEKSRIYLPDDCEVIPCPNVYLSKNPLKMIFMLFNYIHVIKK